MGTYVRQRRSRRGGRSGVERLQHNPARAVPLEGGDAANMVLSRALPKGEADIGDMSVLDVTSRNFCPTTEPLCSMDSK